MIWQIPDIGFMLVVLPVIRFILIFLYKSFQEYAGWVYISVLSSQFFILMYSLEIFSNVSSKCNWFPISGTQTTAQQLLRDYKECL